MNDATIIGFWRALRVFLRRKGIDDVAVEVAGDVIASMLHCRSSLLEGPEPAALPMCIRQQAMTRACALRRKIRRWNQLGDPFFEVAVDDRGDHSPGRSDGLSELKLDVVRKVLGSQAM